MRQKKKFALYMRFNQGLTYDENKKIILEYFKKIRAKGNFAFGRVYYDEGKRSREGLNGLIKDCQKGEFDIIYIRGIRDLKLNISDTIRLIRELIDGKHRVDVVFMNENINTFYLTKSSDYGNM